MVLKSLLLQGFKSFPDKTEIRFSGGMTAIVGPNGSGKSNISDALRWVLGEQSSRSLRGARMEDVIFSGTQKRGPLGFAEVSLILDNSEGVFASEHTEIMVTRRYYRSGESEYFLNKRHCRLKDIHELFMDTGLGRDGYSIIGQGRIDEILSLRSEDRREVFEEAAGITKFRYRKEEAERKLAATEENLVRIRDLYGELESQMEPLARQAEKARQFLLLRDELRVIEVSLWLLELERLRADAEKGRADRETCVSQLAAAQAALADLYQRAETLAGEMRKLDVETDGLRRTLHDSEQQTAALQSRCAVLEADIQHYEENIARAAREEERQGGQVAALAQQQAARQARCAELDAAHAADSEELERIRFAEDRERESKARADRALAALREQIDVRKGENFQLELARTAAQAGLDGMAGRRDTLARDLEQAESQLAAEQAVQQGYEAKRAACRQNAAALQNKRSGLAQKAEHRKKRAEEQAAALAAAQAAATDCENRLRMLHDMQKEYEGFSRAVKRIMKRAESGVQKGVRGPVSALIRVESAFVIAIETALGAASSHIVVETAQDAKAAIAFLKHSDSGRATFLPMDTIRPVRRKETGVESMPGCCGAADTLVSCGEEYRAIVQSLLARTVVAEDMDAALAIAKAYQHRFRVVTLDGQVIQAGGAMTGGSVSKTAGALARAETLRRLEAQRETLRGAAVRAQEALAQAREDEASLENERKALESEIARNQAEDARLTAMCAQHSALLDSVRARRDALALERDNLAAAKQGYADAIREKGEALAAGQQEMERLEIECRLQETAQAAAEEALTGYAAQTVARRTSLAENRTEAAAERRALEDLERLRQEMEQGMRAAGQTRAEFTGKIAESQKELADTRARMQARAEQAETLRAQIAGAAGERMQLEGQKTAADKQAQAHNEEIRNLERENARFDARLSQLQEHETQILTKMWESYELTPTPAAEVAQPLPDPEEAGKRAQALREQMRALGNVNLDAIEEHHALRERFTFLGGQKDDLETAQRDLHQVIERLTGQMKEVFASEFAKLNVFFGQTFREIFGGGHAELQLADTSDILNCGIDILVSPPGKAVKTITLLSGGEKAFVAIALYFAILKLRPTPFTVLDEIEAALDDVNVARFAQYVKRLSGRTQFIVITHRRGTMEQADMLYGVTMQERGVSRMLMLNLAEAEKHMKNEMKN